jgi:hypothetical protein
LVPDDEHSAFGMLRVPAGTEILDEETQDEIIAESIASDMLERLFPDGLTEAESREIHARAQARIRELLNQSDQDTP